MHVVPSRELKAYEGHCRQAVAAAVGAYRAFAEQVGQKEAGVGVAHDKQEYMLVVFVKVPASHDMHVLAAML